MIGKHQNIRLNKIKNYAKNPRHGVATNEKDSLKKLIEKVGSHQMYNLANDINENGMVNSVMPVVVLDQESKGYTVYEGNRRIACLKILKDPSILAGIDINLGKRIKKLKINESIVLMKQILCYVTNEEEAFWIMKKIHSGEDNGKGPKAWSSMEKEIFQSRTGENPKTSLIVTDLVNQHLNIDLSKKLKGFTTVERLFNNREIKKALGLDRNDRRTFTKEKIELINKLSDKVVEESKKSGLSPSRLLNKAREVEDFLLPEIHKISGMLETNEESEKDDTGSNTTNVLISPTEEPPLPVEINNSDHENIPINQNSDTSESEVRVAGEQSISNIFTIKRKNIEINKGNSYNILSNINFTGIKEELFFYSTNLRIEGNLVTHGNSIGSYVINVKNEDGNFQKNFNLIIKEEKLDTDSFNDYRILTNPIWKENLELNQTFDKKIKELLDEIDRIHALGIKGYFGFKISMSLLILSLIELSYIRYINILYGNIRTSDKKGLPEKIMEIVEKMKREEYIDKGTHGSIQRLIMPKNNKGHFITSLNGIKHSDVYPSTQDLYESFEQLRPYFNYCLVKESNIKSEL